MKFLCPSCKAKYQIADEKVSGRSVRMKCRKCGYVIPISEVPPAPPSILPGAGPGAKLPDVPRAPPPPVVSSEPGQAPFGATTGERLTPSPADVRLPPPKRPTLAEMRDVAAKPGGAMLDASRKPPKPGSVPGRPPSSPRASAPGSSPTAAAASVPRAEPPPKKPAALARGSLDLLPAVDEEDDQTKIASGGALAEAFGALVSAEAAATAAPEPDGMPADEWFVGINDVPVGPIRLGEIRKRAMIGAITQDSLVWRDGLEAWRPLRTFPELVAVLEESMSSVQASASPLLLRPSLVEPPPSSPLSPTTGTAVVTDDIAAAGLPRSRTPLGAWIAIAVALLFGVVIGFVVFSRQKPPETVYKIVEVPAKGANQPAVAAVEAAPDKASDPIAPTEKPHTSKGTGTKGTSTAPTDKGTGLTGLKGLSGLSPSGPPGTPGSSPGTTPGGGGGQLDAGQIQSTVSRYTGSVKRRCWQPALDGRDPSAPSTARVVVTIGVAGSGSVQSVSTSGDPRGYPGLSNCIASSVRVWQFPATGGSSTAVVPFVFAAQ